MRILLDVDDVLVAFNKPAHERLKIPIDPWPWPVPQFILPCYDEKFWKSLDVKFWSERPWTPFGRELLTVCEALCKDIWFVTTLAPYPATRDDVKGKMMWMRHHLPAFENKIIFCWDKSCLAHRNALLLDDYNQNIEEFRKAGGNACLVPAVHNYMHHIDPITHCKRTLIQYVKRGLIC